jgi:hypothetical protein
MAVEIEGYVVPHLKTKCSLNSFELRSPNRRELLEVLAHFASPRDMLFLVTPRAVARNLSSARSESTFSI